MFNVEMLSVVMLNVVAPFRKLERKQEHTRKIFAMEGNQL